MRHLILLALVFSSLFASAQKRILVTDKVEAKDSIRLRGRSIAEISRDSEFLAPTHFRVATQKAVRDYVNEQLDNVNVDSLMKSATLSGFLAANSIPYVDGNGRLDARGYQALGAISAPGTPGAGVYVFADMSNRLSWKGVDGYVRTFNGSLSANRVFKFQNKSYTLADSADVAGLSGVYFPLVGGAITGTGGAGFVGLPAQSSAPGTPASGFRLYADATNRLAWKGANGYVRTFDGTANTADRNYTLQNSSGTITMLEAAQTFTGINRFNAFTGFNVAPTSFVHIVPSYSSTGDLSGAGYGFRFASATYTNTSTAAAGVVAAASLFSLDGGTITATNAMTYTTFGTLRIAAAPVASTNVTISVPLALWIASGNSYFQGQISSTSRITALEYFSTTATSGYFSTDTNLGMSLASGNTQLNVFSGSIIFRKTSSGGSTMGLINTTGVRYNGNVAAEIITGPESSDFRYSTQTIIGGGANGVDLLVKGGDAKGNSGASPNNSGDLILQGGYHSGGTLGASWDNGEIIFKTTQNVSAATPTVRGVINASGAMVVGATSVTAGALFELVSTTQGFLGPRATDAQIASFASTPLNLRAFSITSERQNIKRTSGWYQEAFLQDIKRDTSYRAVNANLDISALTSTFANRYKRVLIETVVTAAAAGNNTITMPVPTAALLSTKFEISVEDTSGDGDISVLSFGTDGTDGYLYNGDGTYATTLNLFPGIGVYVSVSWCEAKSAYRWKLQ